MDAIRLKGQDSRYRQSDTTKDLLLPLPDVSQASFALFHMGDTVIEGVAENDQSMPSHQLRRGGSDVPEPVAAIAELRRQLGGGDFAFVLVFFSPGYDRAAIAAAISASFGDTPVFGCTTAGEITPFGYISGGVSAIGFPAGEFQFASGLFERLSEFEIAPAVDRTLLVKADLDGQAEPLAGSGGKRADCFGLLLVDGLSVREEQLVSAIGNTLPGIPLAGGSAADALNFKRCFVLYRGQLHTDAAILLLVRTRRRFSVFKTEHFVQTDRKMVVTGADLQLRRVYEINAEPAAFEYARLVGLEGETLTPRIFAAHPVVVRVGGTYHVRAIQRVNADNSLTFFCAIDEGLVLTVAKGVDMVENLRDLFGRLEAEIGVADLIIGCDCVLRNLELEERHLKAEVSRLFVEHRVVGFCTYGEQYMSMHVNQTFTGIAIGEA
jgi:hypothetical protein